MIKDAYDWRHEEWLKTFMIKDVRVRMSKKQEANPRALSSVRGGSHENSERMEGRGACKRMLRRFGTVPAVPAMAAFAIYIYSVLSFPSRGEQERERERKRDTVNPGDNPGVWPYYILPRGGGLLLDDIILTAAPPVHVSLAHFSRRATERAREQRLSCRRDNGFPGNRGSAGRCIRRDNRGRESMNFLHEWNRYALSRVFRDESTPMRSLFLRFSRVILLRSRHSLISVINETFRIIVEPGL